MAHTGTGKMSIDMVCAPLDNMILFEMETRLLVRVLLTQSRRAVMWCVKMRVPWAI